MKIAIPYVWQWGMSTNWRLVISNGAQMTPLNEGKNASKNFGPSQSGIETHKRQMHGACSAGVFVICK